MTIDVLQKRILAAHTRGDTHELARLQAEYRKQAVTTSADRGYWPSPVRVIGGPPGRPASRVSPERASAVQAPSWPRIVIQESVRSNFEPYDGRERAGWLVGEVREDEIFIVDVVRCGEDDATATTIKLYPEDAARAWLELPLDLSLVGDVHGHPPDFVTEPSDQDVAAWTYVMDQLGRDQWLGLVAREVKGSIHLDLNATLLRREYGRVVHRTVPITTRSY